MRIVVEVIVEVSPSAAYIRADGHQLHEAARRQIGELVSDNFHLEGFKTGKVETRHTYSEQSHEA